MKDRIFVVYLKENGKIIHTHRFTAAEDSVMFNDAEITEILQRYINIVSDQHHIEKSQIHNLELRKDLKEGYQYEVDVKLKKLKGRPTSYSSNVKKSGRRIL